MTREQQQDLYIAVSETERILKKLLAEYKEQYAEINDLPDALENLAAGFGILKGELHG